MESVLFNAVWSPPLITVSYYNDSMIQKRRKCEGKNIHDFSTYSDKTLKN
jgi:hypothetical protein